jgi:ketosteroid isomerase-like protein
MTRLLLASLLVCTSHLASGQTARPSRTRPVLHQPIPAAAPATHPAVPVDSLYRRIAALDAQAFAAFNAHDVDQLMSFFAPGVEFYHDTGGLSDFAQTRQGFAGMFARTADIHRELIPGSLEVYPIKDYGAIQIGAHRFCHQENGRADCGTFRFVMVWQRLPAGWKITRVVSYGH